MRGCRRAREAILASVDREIELADALVLDAHVAECEDCARFQRIQAGIEEAVQRMPEPPLERLDIDGAARALRSRIENAPAQPMRRLEREDPLVDAVTSPWAGKIEAAAAVLLVAGLVGWGAFELNQRLRARPVAPETAPEVAMVAPRSSMSAPPEAGPVKLTDVRAACRGHLVDAFGDVTDSATGLAAFDELAASLRADQWPLLRIVEDLIEDADPRVARAAIRYVGLRGDQISSVRLREALVRPYLGEAAVAAFAERGDDGVDALAWAWREVDGLAVPALNALERIGGQVAAAALEELVIEATPDEREPLLDALAEAGPAAVASLLRVTTYGSVPRRDVLLRLEKVEGADDALVAILDRPNGFSNGLLFDATVALQSDGALAWVEERCHDSMTRPQALATLARWEGVAPWRVLVRLFERGRITREEEVHTARTLIERDAERLTLVARELVDSGAIASASEFLAVLLVSESEGVGPALVELALSTGLPSDDRQWAALAVGELGHPGDIELLAERARELGPEDHRLLAACLVSLCALGGEEAVVSVLERLPDRSARRVVDALQHASERPSAVGLHHVVRALDEAHLAQRFSSRRSTL